MASSRVRFRGTLSLADASTAAEVPLYPESTEGVALVIGSNDVVQVDSLSLQTGGTGISHELYFSASGAQVEPAIIYRGTGAVGTSAARTFPFAAQGLPGRKVFLKAEGAGEMAVDISGWLQRGGA